MQFDIDVKMTECTLKIHTKLVKWKERCTCKTVAPATVHFAVINSEI